MRASRFLLAALVALTAAGCMQHDPNAGEGRGLLAMQASAPQAYAQQRVQPPSVLQYVPAPAPRATEARYRGASSVAPSPYAYAAVEQPYTLGPGDKLRVVVFGQDGISNTYIVDAGGNVSLPLIGSLAVRGITTQQLSQRIAERLKQGYVREPHVTVEVESYRPFFILGEVTTPGQYPYVADMTVEKAIAIAGGFAPRAYKATVELTRSAPGDQSKSEVPLNYPLRPGDTVMVKERWF
jgi:polysaccharide export outer membrane protein